MAKKLKLTDAQVALAEPYVTTAITRKLLRMGASKGAKRFAGDSKARSRAARRAYQQFLDEGGKLGDFQSFMAWLLENADSIIAFISKLIALFSV